MIETKTERNCVRYALETTRHHLEDEIYRLSKQMERGTTSHPLETDRLIKQAKLKLATVRMLEDKLGPYETTPVEVPDALDIHHGD